MRPDPGFWRGRRVLLTGHTGFKGSWLTLMLHQLGAKVTGLSLRTAPDPALFELLTPGLALDHHVVDVRDAAAVAGVLRAARPEVVLHLAAQALVPQGSRDPAGTFETNATGTVNLLEAMRGQDGIVAAVLVTTDKVYRNTGGRRRFREADPLGGADPYSASKAAAEMAIACWRHSFARELPPLAAARAGNVIGGGDFAPTRLVPDIVRAVGTGEPLQLRYPGAVRPWQHVLDVAAGYLLLAELLVKGGGGAPEAVNFAPLDPAEYTVTDIIAAFAEAFGTALPWQPVADVPPEAPHLALDPALAVAALNWSPRLQGEALIRTTAAWYAAWRRGEDIAQRCRQEVAEALG